MGNTDRLFIWLNLILLLAVLSNCSENGNIGVSGKGVVFTVVFILMIAAFFRSDWFRLMSMSSLKSEAKARREVKIRIDYDRAVLAEKGENYKKAASFYEEVLEVDPKHLQARFQLARIYQKRLRNHGKAHLHYRKLAEHAPQGHPFHREAIDVLNIAAPKEGRPKYHHGNA